MERWARSEPHRAWWKDFLKDSRGTGFWHETYCMRGGMEAVYDDVTRPTGFLAFAPGQDARGSMFSARGRARQGREAPPHRRVSQKETSTRRRPGRGRNDHHRRDGPS